MAVIFLLTSCLSGDRRSIPVTGGEDASAPALVELARENVLEYVISSRLPTAPPSADWQLDNGEQLAGEYRFRSGDWLMIISPAERHEGNQRVVIINNVENISWCGYVELDGHVVDTAYIR
ncbi:MAG: hypothetical protein HYZ21_01905 [Chloroflexi bacterium]|nr:hypothetical protein [Chloroflexota bacterium]